MIAAAIIGIVLGYVAGFLTPPLIVWFILAAKFRG